MQLSIVDLINGVNVHKTGNPEATFRGAYVVRTPKGAPTESVLYASLHYATTLASTLLEKSDNVKVVEMVGVLGYFFGLLAITKKTVMPTVRLIHGSLTTFVVTMDEFDVLLEFDLRVAA